VHLQALWIFIAVLVAYYTQIFKVAVVDDRVGRIPLQLALACLACNLVIMLYLCLWLPLIQRINIPWEIYCPRLIPISSGLGVGSFLLFVIAFWSIYGLLAPFIVLLLCMGLIFSTHFIPWPC
jgi:hypothetical protein